MKADSAAGQKYCIDLLTKLVDIPSCFPEEEEIINFLESELTSLGLKPRRIEMAPRRSNLLCTVGDGSPRLCLNAHADTVPANGESTPEARVKGDLLHGLGSCDTKASIASMVTAYLEIAARKDQRGTVDLLISVDEEGDGKGVKAAVAQGYECDFAIVGEPTDLNIVHVHNGLLFLRLTTHGVAAHGCAPAFGINSVERMVQLIEELRAVVATYAPHAVVGGASLNLGEIHAGDRPNRVPEKCVARIDIRFPPPAKVDEVFQAMKNVIDSKEWAEYEVEKRGETLEVPKDSPVIRSIQAAASPLGFTPLLGGLRGWTEAEPFRTLTGIDAVVCGPGNIKQAHSSYEFVSISETQRAAVLYAEVARRLPEIG